MVLDWHHNNDEGHTVNIKRISAVIATAAILLVGGAATAQADSGLSTKQAWSAEHKANKACDDLVTDIIGTAKWERCVKREFKAITGTKMDVLSTQCVKGGTCGLTDYRSSRALPSKREAGARKVRTMTVKQIKAVGIKTSPYGHLTCRTYTFKSEDVIRCSNGVTLKP